jgi:hypothetical protein
MLAQSEFAPGLDGYYYTGQVKFFRLDGRFKIPESSPVLYFLVLVSYLFSDIIFANKLSAAFLGSIILVPAYFLAKEITQNKYAGLLCSLLLAVSSSITYMTVEFVKNLGAMLFIFSFMFFLQRIQSGQKSKSSLIWAAIFGLLAFFSHRSAAILILLILAGGLSLRRKKYNWNSFLIMIGVVSLLLVIFAIFKKLHPAAGGLHLADLGRFENSMAAGFNLPALSGFYRKVLPQSLWLEFSFYFFIPFAGLAFFRTMGPGLKTLTIILLMLTQPFWNLQELGMGFRAYLLAGTLAPVLIAGLVGHWLPSADEKSGAFKIHFFLFLIFLGAVYYQFWNSPRIYDIKKDPPYAYYRKIIESFSLPKDSLLICHRGFNIFYTVTTLKDGLNYIPEYHVPADKLWRLSYFVDFGKYRQYIPEKIVKGDVKELDFPYHLIREDAWRKFLKKIPDYLVESYKNAYNPYEKRPGFLRAIRLER